jgi:hypothetical protein
VESVADSLRSKVHERTDEMSVPERVALALSLGDEAVDLYCQLHGVAPAVSRRRIREQGRLGRVPSACVAALEA